MGIKSTETLTRERAENLYWYYATERKRAKIKAKLAKMTDDELVEKLDKWVDEMAAPEESFTNYRIIRFEGED